MNLIIINKEIFQNRPPVISTLLTLSDLGHNVTLITVEINDYWRNELQKRNVSIHVVSEKKNANRIEKVFEYLNFKNQVFKYLKKEGINRENTLLWVIGGNTIFCLGDTLKKYRFVLQIQELHENNNRYLRAFSKVINDAELVFMNEYNRTVMYQCWFKMKKRPVVLPNKPYFVPTESEINNLKEKYHKEISVFEKYKVILYQGHIGLGRDLTTFVRAVKELGPEYRLVCLGPDHNTICKYQAIDPNVVHIPFIPAPDYLLFTSNALIGIVTYDSDCLNNCYCAPNKIWEYAAFSLPMLCNDIPGLKYTIEHSGAGICVNEHDTEDIKNAIRYISNNRELYRKNAKVFFESVNNREIIEKSLNTLQ